MELSTRLAAIVDFVSPGGRVADIGTDHGYIPIYLALNNKFAHCIATDINQGPLNNAKKHMLAYNVDNIVLRKGSGLAPLAIEDAIDTIMISGMGGHLMIDIIEKDLTIVKACKQLILQPQNAVAELRRYLHAIGMKIEKENLVEDQGKYYPILSVVHGEESYETVCEYTYGKYMLQHPTVDFFRYMDHKKEQFGQIAIALEGINTPTSEARKKSLEEEVALYKEALTWLA